MTQTMFTSCRGTILVVRCRYKDKEPRNCSESNVLPSYTDKMASKSETKIVLHWYETPVY